MFCYGIAELRNQINANLLSRNLIGETVGHAGTTLKSLRERSLRYCRKSCVGTFFMSTMHTSTS